MIIARPNLLAASAVEVVRRSVEAELGIADIEWAAGAGRCGMLSALRGGIVAPLASVTVEFGTKATAVSTR